MWQQDETLIGDLYGLAVQLSSPYFRRAALQRLLKVIQVDGAVWASGPMAQRELERISCVGLPDDFAKNLTRFTHENPIMSHLVRAQGNPVDMREAVEDAVFFNSDFYQACFAPYDVQRVLSSLKIHTETQVFTLLSVYRKRAEAVFTEEDKQRQQRLLYHLHRCDHACLQADMKHPWLPEQLAVLSEREQQVVAELMKNQTMKQIAKRLSLSPSTVANHLYRIYQKLDVSGKAELFAFLDQ